MPVRSTVRKAATAGKGAPMHELKAATEDVVTHDVHLPMALRAASSTGACEMGISRGDGLPLAVAFDLSFVHRLLARGVITCSA